MLKLKTPWRKGTAHLVMSPLEFMQRLAALIPYSPAGTPRGAREAASTRDCFAATNVGR
jgi:hypothetical protein